MWSLCGCMSAQCTTTGPFSRLSLKSPRLSLSGHSFFLGFHPIVFKEKGLVAHPHPAWWLHSVLRAGQQQEGRVCRWGTGGLMTVYYSLVEWICELVWLAHSAGWVAWVRAGHQIQTKTNTTTKTVSITLLFFFIFFLYSSVASPFTHLALCQMNWTCVIPVLKPSFC